MPGAAFGLVSAGIASVTRVARYAAEPRTGALLGLVYGLILSAVTVWRYSPPRGGDTIHGLTADSITFGVLIGVLYASSLDIG